MSTDSFQDKKQTSTSSIFAPAEFEPRWQQFWQDLQLFQRTPRRADHEKIYLLFAFAYPSGSGLHVGHAEPNTALDILARYYRMNDKDVFFPVGWDAFGLPAENYAIKTGVPPAETTKKAINTFRGQLRRLGISYDWATEIATCHPSYYKWTQWIFLQLYQAGLAYKKNAPVNWCSSCQTVLANEQVVDGKCERCGTQVIQKEMNQWFFKISEFQDELVDDLANVDWPTATKEQQLNWIGRKRGANITYPIIGTEEEIVCFTTRPETNFGASFIVLSPEHRFVKQIVDGQLASQNKEEITKYVTQAKTKTERQRLEGEKQKTGVFTGFYALNRLNNKQLPVWVADFVLPNFGTGAVVGVPAHDERDFAFAQAFSLPIQPVISVEEQNNQTITKSTQIYTGNEGKLINSDFLNGKDVETARKQIVDFITEKGWGEPATTYKLRDWLISRQRYWGAPIPIVYDPDGNAHPVKEEHLPWLLPTDVDFQPTGESPLVSSQEFIARTEALYGKGWRPEFDTMDTFVDSSWYYIRYADARNELQLADKAKLTDWLPVDFYMIGPEHIVLHLLYSRFFTKFLHKQGLLSFNEPFLRMRHQGIILAPDGKRMSKSKGNVINPDDVINKFGADTLRVYEMFMGPIEADKPWDPRAVAGVYRFLNKCFELVSGWQEANANETDSELTRKLHRTIKKVSHDLPELKFNTAIASLMEFANLWSQHRQAGSTDLTQMQVLSFIKMLAPLAPFLSEELYQRFAVGKPSSVHQDSWPTWEENLTVEATLKLPVQINGKLRGLLEISADDARDSTLVIAKAKSLEPVRRWLIDKEVIKEIYIANRAINLVVK